MLYVLSKVEDVLSSVENLTMLPTSLSCSAYLTFKNMFYVFNKIDYVKYKFPRMPSLLLNHYVVKKIRGCFSDSDRIEEIRSLGTCIF